MSGEIINEKGLALALGAKLLYDVCGPTAKYLGGELASYSQIGVTNLKRVFERALQRIHELNKAEGQVPPRVLKDILLEGYFCEDELEATYLGGVLASSKGPVSRDDRAVAHCSLISSLSCYQLRTHCVLYTAILHATQQRFPDILRWLYSHGVSVCIREQDYQAAMEFSEIEQPTIIAQHAFVGLEKRGLSEGGFHVITPHQPKTGDVPFRFFYPTTLGIELFLWGQGLGDLGIEDYTPKLLGQISLPFTVEPYDVQLGRVSWG